MGKAADAAREYERKIRESDVEDYFVNRVRSMGGEVRKVKWIGRKSAPDRVAMIPMQRDEFGNTKVMRLPYPVTLWVELKRPGEDPRPDQKREHERMRAVGQIVVVIDSFAGVDALLA